MKKTNQSSDTICDNVKNRRRIPNTVNEAIPILPFHERWKDKGLKVAVYCRVATSKMTNTYKPQRVHYDSLVGSKPGGTHEER
ncbi:hypothetical protein FACS18949_02310 [Clostridia bacterium]|nr:hypothetical protein FACS18949_02310 [Clostridia bacterium]